MFQLKFLFLLIQIYQIQSITHENILLPASFDSAGAGKNARKFLQKYTSSNPVVLLVDDVQQSHDEALSFLKNVRRLSPRPDINFMLMKFNTTGASEILETTNNNMQRFEQLLGTKTESSSSLGVGESKSEVFFGILKAAHVVPQKSGIVVFIKREIVDDALVQHARLEVAKREIQVFVISGSNHEESLLKELAVRSYGAFLPFGNMSTLRYENFLENIETVKSASVLLSQKNLRGNHDLEFPVDSDVTGIYITTIPFVTRGIVTTPRGYHINVLDDKEVSQFSSGSFINRENRIHEVHLNTTASPEVGIWRLRVGNARTLYNITIFAHTKLTTNALVTTTNLTGTNEEKRKIVTLRLTGDVGSINNISFVTEDGKPLFKNVKFTLDKNWENHLTENIKKQVNVTVATVPKEPFYAVVNGKDSQGNDFRRMSYVRHEERKDFYLPPLTIELGVGSELITQPYQQPQLLFEVTNNGYSPILARFLCRDDKSLLRSMDPWYRWISPHETATVRVTLSPRPGAYQDFITFTASGTDTASKKVIVDVGRTREDRREPDLEYHFQTDCIGIPSWSCETGIWTVEVKARDRDSGLLQVTSHPRGMYFPNGFTSGSTEEVIGFFTESCCNPDLKLIAIDRQNNRRVRHINAYHAALGPGAIAAIVLGVILLILIIIGLIFLYRHCSLKRKQTGSFDLPVYRGPRRT